MDKILKEIWNYNLLDTKWLLIVGVQKKNEVGQSMAKQDLVKILWLTMRLEITYSEKIQTKFDQR